MSKTKKRCGKCKRWLPVAKFQKNKSTKDGLQHYCKSCSNVCKKWYRESAKGKVTAQKYRESNEGKAAQCKYAKSDEGKVAQCKYQRSDKGKATVRKRTYGITVRQYDKLFKQQKGCCAICGKPSSVFKKGLGVDHNHTTGKVRGLLCTVCNYAFEQFASYPKRFNQYLKQK